MATQQTNNRQLIPGENKLTDITLWRLKVEPRCSHIINVLTLYSHLLFFVLTCVSIYGVILALSSYIFENIIRNLLFLVWWQNSVRNSSSNAIPGEISKKFSPLGNLQLMRQYFTKKQSCISQRHSIYSTMRPSSNKSLNSQRWKDYGTLWLRFPISHFFLQSPLVKINFLVPT